MPLVRVGPALFTYEIGMSQIKSKILPVSLSRIDLVNKLLFRKVQFKDEKKDFTKGLKYAIKPNGGEIGRKKALCST